MSKSQRATLWWWVRIGPALIEPRDGHGRRNQGRQDQVRQSLIVVPWLRLDGLRVLHSLTTTTARESGNRPVGHLTIFGLHEREGRERSAGICIVVTNSAAVRWDIAAGESKVACQNTVTPSSAVRSSRRPASVLPPISRRAHRGGIQTFIAAWHWGRFREPHPSSCWYILWVYAIHTLDPLLTLAIIGHCMASTLAQTTALREVYAGNMTAGATLLFVRDRLHICMCSAAQRIQPHDQQQSGRGCF